MKSVSMMGCELMLGVDLCSFNIIRHKSAVL